MDNVINIIDREFNFLGQIDDYDSFFPTKKWHSIGRFELHLHEDTTHADKLVKENIIFTTLKKAYVILYREIDSTDGKLVVKGLELKSYLSRWLVFPPEGQAYYRINSNIETIMKEYVQSTLDRKGIKNIVVAPNQNRGLATVYQSRYKNLAEELEKISLASGLGWDITLDLDNRKFIFDVIEGQDRTANQDILPPAIFSIEYDNIAEQKLIESRINYANTAIVAGQGEGVDREITIVGDGEGLDSFEIFVDARDLENANDLPERGQQKLSEVQEIFTFDSIVLADKNLIYEEDFNLGDIVTIQNSKWNITADRRITEITETYEKDGFRLDVAFGESMPDLIEKIKKSIDTPIAEGGSQGEPGLPGADGEPGIGLQYSWDGTKLGVKREDESKYTYANLVGPQGERGPQGLRGDKGDQGPQGIPGLNGKSLEFDWNGTQLGIRVEGQANYQYVNLKGEKGDTGPKGADGYTPIKGIDYFDGEQGPKGDQGIQGPQGIQGKTGPMGPQGRSIEYVWNGTKLGIRVEGETSYTYVDLRGPQGSKGDTGPQGPKGDIGPEGSQGPIGLTGPKGDTGAKGDKGDKPNHRWVSQTQIQFENPDGTWGEIIDLNPDTILIHQEYFISTEGQEIFNLTKGAYRLGTNSVIWYLDGIKQSNDAIEEISPTSIRIKGGVPGNSSIIIEYIEFANVAIGLKGEKGDKGDTGPMGPQGPKGDRGPQGIQGPRGDVGPQGPKGEDGYTPVKGLDYFDGARGDKGDTGPMGPVGPKGDTGPRGPEGPQGPPGEDGSDAEVTKENIINAIGYTPADKKDLDDLEIGARNLLIQNNFKQNTALASDTGIPTTVNRANLSDKIFVYSNKEVTISRKGGTVNNINGNITFDYLKIGFFNANDESIKLIEYPYSVNKKPPVTHEIPVGTIYIMISSSREDLYNLKAEFGTKPTDWTPAPEDIQAEIDEVKGNIPTKVSQLTNDAGYLKSLPNHNHKATEVKFTDGETFQQKLDLGKLTGPQGPQGEQGPKGEQGPQGPRGYTGPKGDTGLQGPKGDKGDVGPQGPPGTTTWAGITDRPTKLSQFQNDLVIESGGTKIVTSATEPSGLSVGDQWHRTY